MKAKELAWAVVMGATVDSISGVLSPRNAFCITDTNSFSFSTSA